MLYLGGDGAKDRGPLEVEGGFGVGDLESILVVLVREPDVEPPCTFLSPLFSNLTTRPPSLSLHLPFNPRDKFTT